MDFHLLFLFCVAFASAVIVPGPNVAFAVAQALKYGVKITIPGAFGFGLATAVHAAVVLSGVGLIVHEHRWILTYLRWIGAIYLIYHAFRAFFAKADDGDEESKRDDSSTTKMFTDSLLVSLANPKGWLASLMTYPSFINAKLPYVPQAVSLGLAAMLISLSIYGGYMFLANKASAAFNNRAAINKVTGVTYLLVAIFLMLMPI